MTSFCFIKEQKHKSMKEDRRQGLWFFRVGQSLLGDLRKWYKEHLDFVCEMKGARTFLSFGVHAQLQAHSSSDFAVVSKELCGPKELVEGVSLLDAFLGLDSQEVWAQV